MPAQMLWFSPAEYRLASPGLTFVDTPRPRNVEIAVRSSKTGPGQWIGLPLSLPADAALAHLELCYQVSDARTAIRQLRISALHEPGQATILYADSKTRNSTAPICEKIDLRQAGKPQPAILALTLELDLDFGGADTVTLGAVGCEIATEEHCACHRAANEHVLSEYYTSPPDVRAALRAGVQKILTEKGGFLCIPPDAATVGFVPRNRAGHREVPDPVDPRFTIFESVTVKDARRGVERSYLPPVGDANSELTAFAGRIAERDLAIDLGWQGTYSVDSLCSRLYGGGSSYSMRLSRMTKKGEQRFYVPTLMGIFPGQRLKIGLLEEPIFTVAQLGQDAAGPFFETRETAPSDIPQQASLYNKHNVNVLSLSDTSNSDNQGAVINLNRRAYGAGDVFMMAGILEYQSNIYSGLGDEGGVGCAVNLLHDLESFHGEVESWTPNPGRESEVVYKPTGDTPPLSTRNTQKLGTSRPLINLNRSRWKFDGWANVVPPGENPAGWLPGLPAPAHRNGCVLIRPDTVPADWRKLIGSFIALVGQGGTTIDDTDGSEYYKKNLPPPAVHVIGDVHRWWYITDVQDAGGGRVYIFVDRVIQRDHAVAKSGPLLFRDANYTKSSAQLDERRLRYIIAPGAWVSDVRHGVAGNVLGNAGAQPADPRRILLAPGQPELAANDPITNPPGPDVAHPTGFRALHVHHFPAFGPGTSFLSDNIGSVQVGSGLHIAGAVKNEPGESVPAALQRVQKDQKPHYANGIWISGTTETAVRIDGYTQKSAIELWQAHGDQNVVWMTQNATGFSTLRGDRESGDFVFSAIFEQQIATATLTGPHGLTLTELRGLSGTSKKARNLRGHEPVAEKATGVEVTFPKAEPDETYHLFIQCSWLTQSAVVKRTANGFKVEFSVQAPENASFDWLLVR